MRKLSVHKQTRRTAQKHTEQQHVTDNQNKQIFVFWDFSIFILDFFKYILQEMLSFRLGTVNVFHWGLKQF